MPSLPTLEVGGLLSSLYTIQQFPVASKAAINYLVPSWSMGNRCLSHLLSADIASLPFSGISSCAAGRYIPDQCRFLPTQCVQTLLVTQSVLERSHQARINI